MKTVCWKLTLFGALAVLAGGCATPQATPGPATEAAAPVARPVRTVTAAAPQASPMAVAAPAAKPAPTLPPPSEIEKQYGVQIAHVGLTAQGGLVDVRFKVLDAAKARVLLGNPANAPQLIAGDKPPLLPPHRALHGARFSTGQVFYILYPNTRSAVQPGVEVMVAVGAARLGPVTAQ